MTIAPQYAVLHLLCTRRGREWIDKEREIESGEREKRGKSGEREGI